MQRFGKISITNKQISAACNRKADILVRESPRIATILDPRELHRSD